MGKTLPYKGAGNASGYSGTKRGGSIDGSRSGTTAGLYDPFCNRRDGEISDDPDYQEDDIDTISTVRNVVGILQGLNVGLQHQVLNLGKNSREKVGYR